MLIQGDGWERCFDLAFRVFSSQAKCELLCGEEATAYQLFDMLMTKAPADMDRAAIYLTMIQLE